MQYGDFVNFIVSPSLDYMAGCTRKYDFIFIDGDHAAKTVYQEIARALDLLRDDGVIVLHDYFPGAQPLWTDGNLLPGPFLAAERLKDETPHVLFLPLGALPWPTKQDSNKTSLALVLKEP
jgi:hypothetical protein